MTTLLLVCCAEWQYWWRSRLAGNALLLMLVVLAASTLYAAVHSHAESERRARLQEVAEQRFFDQPARHPHRMVHYGHYAFRAQVPLAALDPGVDDYAGVVMFLEGHRQNNATFAEATELASLSRVGNLSPAYVLQVLAPLLLIVMGFNAVTRERDRRTLWLLQTAGVDTRSLLAGKALALGAVVAVMLLPLLLAGLLLTWGTEAEPAAVLGLVVVHAGYLLMWALVVLGVSTLVRHAAASLAVLLLGWVVTVMVLPRVAADLAQTLAPVPGKLASDLAQMTEGATTDGHNAADPGFAALTAQLLDAYGVDNVADLPINIRGRVSAEGEAAATAAMNRYAEARFEAELQQTALVDRLAVLSPLLAVRRASMTLAGTDLAHYHRFLRDAESVRFEFVQGLNRLHAEQLDYEDDIKRSVDAGAEQRTRVAASFWQLLPRYRFEVTAVAQRLQSAIPMTGLLLLWLLAAVGFCGVAARRVPA